MFTNKPQKELFGMLRIPITVGSPAYIAEMDGDIRTSTVLAVLSENRTHVVFETRNTIYTLKIADSQVIAACREAVS